MNKHSQKQSAIFNEDGLFFVPLGGSEQFGVNLNVYICNGEMLAVDCGIGFADERFPGIDLLLPDPAFIEQHLDALKGIIITHAHEDHIGALAYMWERLKCPIYASPFTAAVLRKKFAEKNIRKASIHIIAPRASAKIGAFEAQFVPVSHSVPDTCSLIINTPHGRIVHSGDWNLDPAPVVGEPTDEALLKEAGNAGVLAYVGDSTNAEVDGRSGSEADVAKGLEAEFKKCKGKIAVTTFSSNIGRIVSIVKAAEACDRKVGVIGRSLHRMIGCAYECGMLDDIPDFIDEDDFGYLPDDKIVVIVTGSQGEYRAALAKIARGDFRNFSLNRNDTVIFSARAIPGNEVAINQVKNNLSGAGVEVITPRDTKKIIHVSGHPCRDEIAQMLQWVRPQILIPVHGERMQLDAHAAFAAECQIPQAIVPSNGSVIQLAPGKASLIDHVETDVLAVDQKRIINANHGSITERRKLQYSGTVHASIVVDGRGEMVTEPKLETVGLLDFDNSGEEQVEDRLFDHLLDKFEDMSFEDRQDDEHIAEKLRIAARRFCDQTLGIKPKTTIHVLRV